MSARVPSDTSGETGNSNHGAAKLMMSLMPGIFAESPSAILGHLNGVVTGGEALGYLAVVLTVATYSMRTMIPLRTIGICANCLFIAYGILAPSYPQLVLHAVLLPLNSLRLYQMIRLVSKVRAASEGDLSMEWIKSFTTSRQYRNGETIFAKGDVADVILYPVSGRYRLVEIGIDIPAGEIVGEIGLVTPGNKRTQTLKCVEDGEVLVVSYNQIERLYFQNPSFGFFFLRLITKRLLANQASLEERFRHLTEKQWGPTTPATAGQAES